MKKALMIASVLLVAVISTACINNIAVQELNNKASEYMQKGDYESAMNRLQASLDLDSTMYQTYYNLGIAAIGAKKYDKAIEAFESGIKINPNFADFYYSLGVAQISKADEILEPETENTNEDSDNNNNKIEDKSNLENLKEAILLKHEAKNNLEKFLNKVPNTKDRPSVEEMIAQSNEFIESHKLEPIDGDSFKE